MSSIYKLSNEISTKNDCIIFSQKLNFSMFKFLKEQFLDYKMYQRIFGWKDVKLTNDQNMNSTVHQVSKVVNLKISNSDFMQQYFTAILSTATS